MKKILLSAVICLNTFLMAQDVPKDTTYWTNGGAVNFTFSQVQFNNWAAGGENTASFNGLISFFENYKKGKIAWDNSLDLGFGLTKQGDANVVKSDDRIELQSKFGMKRSEKWYYSALGNFKSQFAPAFSDETQTNKISQFMSPAYYTLSLGMDYRPSDQWSAMLSPITGKVTFVLDDSLNAIGAYGVDSNKAYRAEFGAALNFNSNFDIRENINFMSKLQLFSNYMEEPQNVDVFWEMLWTIKLTKYLGFTYSTLLMFDQDIPFVIDENEDGIAEVVEAKVQFKQIFGAGITYKF